ncbi:hypothetical protein MARINOS108_120053 [Marinoscillum sp. 108]|nr:hypothetical protein MARINOS108_120053 [Marinoscillum sp. 108]
MLKVDLTPQKNNDEEGQEEIILGMMRFDSRIRLVMRLSVKVSLRSTFNNSCSQNRNYNTQKVRCYIFFDGNVPSLIKKLSARSLLTSA